MVFLLLVNNYRGYNTIDSPINGLGQLVFDNSSLIRSVQVSIENLIVKFSMISELVELLNVDILGFSEDEFQNVVKEFLEQNS